MLKEGNLEYRFPDCPLGLSARRLWEHTECRQINPFPAIDYYSAARPEAYIDVIAPAEPYPDYPGVSLDDLQQGRAHLEGAPALLERLHWADVRQWREEVCRHLQAVSARRAVRNAPTPFLRTDRPAPLGIPGLRCALGGWLREHGQEKAPPTQWLSRLQNLTGKGLKKEELSASGLEPVLSGESALASVAGQWLEARLDYRQLRISIVPVVTPAANHLAWLPAPPQQYVKRLKPKVKGKPPTAPQWRDPVLGYWVDKVEWNDLLGPARGWMVFSHRGKPLVTADHPTGLYDTPEAAKARANRDAAQVLPRLSARGNWARYRLTGGEDYREWLITLPFYPSTYHSDHFAHRNVLLHLRTDCREGVDGEKVLFVQEIQSDWAQEARREQPWELEDGPIPPPPWLQEWPVLALKLVLLHAADRGFDTLAWTTGEDQIKRYSGLGEAGLRTLYDRTLPKEADKLLKPFGLRHGTVDLFLPTNFYIEPCEDGYQVFDSDEYLIGQAATWRKAQRLIPDGAHEVLATMHGINLDKATRQAILERGFPA